MEVVRLRETFHVSSRLKHEVIVRDATTGRVLCFVATSPRAMGAESSGALRAGLNESVSLYYTLTPPGPMPKDPRKRFFADLERVDDEAAEETLASPREILDASGRRSRHTWGALR